MSDKCLLLNELHIIKIKYLYEMLCCMILASSVACRSDSQKIQMNHDRIIINGRIDKEVSDFFRDNDISNLKYLTINSRGGSVKDAILIAEKIQSLDVTLIINGECMSACATIILPSAKIIVVDKNSVVALHGSQYGLRNLFVRSAARDNHGIRQSNELIKNAKIEENIVRKSKIDARYLLLPYVTRGDICYKSLLQSDGEFEFGIGTRRPSYIISPSTLKAFGVNVRYSSDGIDDVSILAKPDFLPDDVDLNAITRSLHPCV